MDTDSFDIDDVDITFMGLGAYLNEKEQLIEESKELNQNNNFERVDKINIAQQMPRKTSLRPFEQHVQNSIDKLNKNK